MMKTTMFASVTVNIHRDILGDAGESLLEACRAARHNTAQHSRDETLVICISPDVFRGRRGKRGGWMRLKDPRDSVYVA